MSEINDDLFMQNSLSNKLSNSDLSRLAQKIKRKASNLGFQKTGISDTDLTDAESHLFKWLSKNFHADMHYMSKHGTKRSRPEELESGTVRIISVRMDYFPTPAKNPQDVLNDTSLAYISRYALGRDYHKVLRQRLQKLANYITSEIGPFGYRVFVDSAPVLEKAIAEKAGLGWIGKHSNLLSRDAGSWFFLGEVYVDIPLPVDEISTSHCGNCTACIDECPTDAIISPYVVDARRCISYLTIENKSVIPLEYREAMGNRIYGCDDCQLVCPWNRFSEPSNETDYQVRHQLDCASLLTLFEWDENQFLKNTEGSAIRRIGYTSWIRNISVALGNQQPDKKVYDALGQKMGCINEMVDEHIKWAMEKHKAAV